MTLERRDKKRRKTKSDVEYALRVARDLNLELHLKKATYHQAFSERQTWRRFLTL